MKTILQSSVFYTLSFKMSNPKYSIVVGTVQHGEERGRVMGFPTLNLDISQSGDVLEYGVYAAKAEIGGVSYSAAVHFGPRPTFGEVKPMFEVHLLDTKGDFYGKTAKVTLLDKVRDVQKFSSTEALAEQLHHDVEIVRVMVRQVSP